MISTHILTKHLIGTKQAPSFPHFIMQLTQGQGKNLRQTVAMSAMEFVATVVFIAQTTQGSSVRLVVADLATHAFYLTFLYIYFYLFKMLILLILLISSSQACELLWFDNTHFLYECDQLQPKCMRLRNNGNKMILMCSEQIIINARHIINTTNTEAPTIAPTTTTDVSTTIAHTTTTDISHASTTTTIIPTTVASTTTTIIPTTVAHTTTTDVPTTTAPTTTGVIISTTNRPTVEPTSFKRSYLRNQVDVKQNPSKEDNSGFIVAIILLSVIICSFMAYIMYQKRSKNKRKSIMPKVDQENKKIQRSIEKKQIIKRVREEMKKANITTNRVPTLQADLKTAMKINEVKPSIATVAKIKTQLPKRPKRPSELERMTIEDWRKLNHNVKGQQADKKVIQMMQRNKVVNNSNFK